MCSLPLAHPFAARPLALFRTYPAQAPGFPAAGRNLNGNISWGLRRPLTTMTDKAAVDATAAKLALRGHTKQAKDIQQARAQAIRVRSQKKAKQLTDTKVAITFASDDNAEHFCRWISLPCKPTRSSWKRATTFRRLVCFSMLFSWFSLLVLNSWQGNPLLGNEADLAEVQKLIRDSKAAKAREDRKLGPRGGTGKKRTEDDLET
jgi:hypothetical protein